MFGEPSEFLNSQPNVPPRFPCRSRHWRICGILARMSELALVLGAAVVKAAVRLWAGGGPFGDELAGDLTDLIKGRVSGALDQRKVRRQFDQMEEIVADQVLAVMGEEFRDLDEGERYAA